MNDAMVECNRISRDLAEVFWRSKDVSPLVSALSKTALIGCNDFDRIVSDSLAELQMLDNIGGQCLLHWISETAQSYVVPIQDLKILYVVRPAQLSIVYQNVLGNSTDRALSMELARDVALIYRYQ
jgi:hypothetical protein